MEYTLDGIEKILNFKTWSDKKKVDELLRIDCWLYCNLGMDSSNQEKLEVRKKSRVIYVKIKKINPLMGEMFLQNLDKG